jgi:hypothetical protein
VPADQGWAVAEEEIAIKTLRTLLSAIETDTGCTGVPILVKLDIEGMEWSVLPGLALDGLLCRDKVTAVTMELHYQYTDQPFTAAEFARALDVTDRSCVHTTLLELDDESYLHDGIPLPCEEEVPPGVLSV